MNKLIIAAGCFFLLVFILPGYIFNIGSLTGIALSILLALYGYRFDAVNAWMHSHTAIRNTLFAVMGLIAALAVLVTIFMASACRDTARGDETVVVLGCGVNGTVPSRMLYTRIKAAEKYLTAHPDAVAILSGGQGSDEEISEAAAMYNVLTARGIAPERLLKEENSTSTIENLTFSQETIQENGLNPAIVIISNEFHLYRASRIASALKIQASCYPASTPIDLFLPNYVRELYAILYEWLRTVI